MISIVHNYGDRNLWVSRGKEADERCDVMLLRPLAIDELLGGARLAGDIVAVNRRLDRRAALLGDSHQHGGDLRRRLGRNGATDFHAIETIDYFVGCISNLADDLGA